MTPNTMEKMTGPKPASCETSCMSAVEYFTAKLDCEMTPWTLKGMMDKNAMKDVCLIDVRPVEDYKKCHISMAMCIPLAELGAKMNTLPKDKTIVAYCGDMTCGLAPKACLELSKKGFKAMMLIGGMESWMEKRFPTDK
ncbi:MAG: rhodanese-like domain-containing protein [Elusimicrobiota bacterium]|nr:MAG: rhodanese-like domain-containing protein [Elusimicrobiota bacterium]